MTVAIHWFRRDLRLADNLALHAACASGASVMPLFIFDRRIYQSQRVGTPRMALLLQALVALDEALQRFGTRLLVCYGQPTAILPALVQVAGVSAVYYNADYSPYARQRDNDVQRCLNIPVHRFDDVALLAPGTILTASGSPYTQFSAFRRGWNSRTKPDVSSLKLQISMFHPLTDIPNAGLPHLSDLGFLTPSLRLPEATEAAAQQALNTFMAEDINTYATTRNQLPIHPFVQPRPVGTSYISAYLRLGMLSPRMAYHAARHVWQQTDDEAQRQSIETWVSELTWRDFYMHILYHFPYVLARDFQDRFLELHWHNHPEQLAAWQAGRTGYPVVDAAMRQLNTIGWMPNRARMIVASFLTKDLLIHWKHGDIYFMRHLIDGDPAANNGGWQWAAGTGTDAQPYFRIFNPVAQSRQYASPVYLRYWLPELEAVPDDHIHAPWTMPDLRTNYPHPIVDHRVARAEALAAFKEARIRST